MSSTLIEGMIRSWTSLYTKGLPSELGAERRAEVESDLWEQDWLWQERGLTGLFSQRLGRWLLGMPADLSWRLEQRGPTKNPAEDVGSKLERMIKLATTTVQKVMLGLVVLLAAYQLVVVVFSGAAGVGILNAEEAPGWTTAGELFLAFISAVGIALIAFGLRQRAQAPERAGMLFPIGVVPSIVMFWLIIPPIIALVVAVYSVLNGRTQQRQLTAGT